MKVKIKYKDMLARGLFADEFIPKNNIILVLKGNHFPEPTRTSIQIEDGKHLEHYEGAFMNHHCDPNTEIKVHEYFVGSDVLSQCSSNPTTVAVAKKDILEGEEITFDYETTEFDLAEPFRCDCHGRWIRGKVYRYQE